MNPDAQKPQTFPSWDPTWRGHGVGPPSLAGPRLEVFCLGVHFSLLMWRPFHTVIFDPQTWYGGAPKGGGGEQVQEGGQVVFFHSPFPHTPTTSNLQGPRVVFLAVILKGGWRPGSYGPFGLLLGWLLRWVGVKAWHPWSLGRWLGAPMASFPPAPSCVEPPGVGVGQPVRAEPGSSL